MSDKNSLSNSSSSSCSNSSSGDWCEIQTAKQDESLISESPLEESESSCEESEESMEDL
ncbi:hypothetical protein SPSYN_01487 [Sporotomaculum syntrophicum]|uniref:Uncharacterized protein n=1 Tax=Sporotomaculum syntrophicum TaxID=182264 RepID=A0A9D2WR20_9FIRM|nr:hypothetical protein [Sporotomaculum syntrophicum]KAF1085351.1 hypothetical protein SPSYN_01487 [Sporotomaculum syntrophicum]